MPEETFDPNRTTPRLPGEPLANYELRATVSTLHRRIDGLFHKLGEADASREELGRVAARIEIMLTQALKDIEDHEMRIRKGESTNNRNLGAASIMGAVAGYVAKLIFPPHQ